MRKFKISLLIVNPVLFVFLFSFNIQRSKVFTPDDKRIQYIGRFDFSNPMLPRVWSPGAYIRTAFVGQNCDVYINDEELGGRSHNFIEITVDDTLVQRIQTTGKTNVIKAARGLTKGMHTLTICKDTESGIGYLEFAGIKCKDLSESTQHMKHRIEFIGNSITCGAGSDPSLIPCGNGEWYDQHNAYMSYGPVAARMLDAEWILSAVSGIGLIRSCCDMKINMPEVFDKLNMRKDTIQWDFNNFSPDVVTICLGQNDGIQDSTEFCTAYINFIRQIRGYYPNSEIICLSSPMADDRLSPVLKNYINAIASFLYQAGDTKVRRFFFSRSFNNGCGGHPDLVQHQEIALELTAYVRKVMHW